MAYTPVSDGVIVGMFADNTDFLTTSKGPVIPAAILQDKSSC